MLWRTEQTCGKRLPRGGARSEQTYMGEGFHGEMHGGGGELRKILFGGKLPYFGVESGWRRGGFSAVRHFGIAPILGLSRNVPRGTLTDLGRFPKTFHVEHWCVSD
jgi:hypothetical protein